MPDPTEPVKRSPLSTGSAVAGWNRGAALSGPDLTVTDVTGIAMWRTWSGRVPMGMVSVTQDRTEFSTSPDEATVIADGPMPPDAVDLTHVRATVRVSGSVARDLLMRLTALDLTADMFGVHSAARTLVAGITTEIVHDATDTYLLVTSRSFARSLWHALEFAATDWAEV